MRGSAASQKGPTKSANGFVLFVSNINTRATDTSVSEAIIDAFSLYGEVSNVVVNLDRKTGFVKGYALVEYHTIDEARACLQGMKERPLEFLVCPEGAPLSRLERVSQLVIVDWAYTA